MSASTAVPAVAAAAPESADEKKHIDCFRTKHWASKVDLDLPYDVRFQAPMFAFGLFEEYGMMRENIVDYNQIVSDTLL